MTARAILISLELKKAIKPNNFASAATSFTNHDFFSAAILRASRLALVSLPQALQMGGLALLITDCWHQWQGEDLQGIQSPEAFMLHSWPHLSHGARSQFLLGNFIAGNLTIDLPLGASQILNPQKRGILGYIDCK